MRNDIIMANTFATKKEAIKEAAKRNERTGATQRVWNIEKFRKIPMKKRKMKKPFFVGSEIEFLNH